MKKEDIESKAKKAIELVRGIEDDFKIAAFQIIFSKLLDESNVASTNDKGATKYSQEGNSGTQIVAEISKTILDKIDVNKLQYLKSLNSVHDQSLALLVYFSKNVREHPALTTDEMKEIFAEKFGLTTITVNNISMSLKNVTGKFVTRKEIIVKTPKTKTKKYRYEILQKGMEYIEAKIAEVKKPDR